MSKEYPTEQEHLDRLSRNRVRIEEKYTERNGVPVVLSRVIRPAQPPGLKVLSSILALTQYFRKGKYYYEMSAT